MVVTSGDLIRHYHAFSHHNKGRPIYTGTISDATLSLCKSGFRVNAMNVHGVSLDIENYCTIISRRVNAGVYGFCLLFSKNKGETAVL
jgi:hypothetical protein